MFPLRFPLGGRKGGFFLGPSFLFHSLAREQKFIADWQSDIRGLSHSIHTSGDLPLTIHVLRSVKNLHEGENADLSPSCLTLPPSQRMKAGQSSHHLPFLFFLFINWLSLIITPRIFAVPQPSQSPTRSL